jgi:MFS family permease
MRLCITLVLMIVGASGMYVMAVVLPAVQAHFQVDRGLASMPYTLTMLGVGVGGLFMGRMADRSGIMRPLLLGGACLGAGFIAAALAPNIWCFMAAHCLLIGLLGTACTFSPLVADTSLWFRKRRGIAVARAPAATTWAAHCGRPSSSTSSTASAGSTPTSAWV